MPIYEFECLDCRTRFEELVRRATDLPEVRCPACDGAELQRLMSAPAAGGSGEAGSAGVAAQKRACSTFS